MYAIQTKLIPSKSWWYTTLILHLILSIIAIIYLNGIFTYLWLAGLVLSLSWAWYKQRSPYYHRIHYLNLKIDGTATISIGSQNQPAKLIAIQIIYTGLIILTWSYQNKTHQHFIAADMLDTHTFRQLKVWATCHAKAT